MSRYAKFICLDCQVYLRLGKAVYTDYHHINYFHRGPLEGPQNSESPDLTRALWKMLAEHAGHELRVGVEDDTAHGSIYNTRAVEEGFQEIGGYDPETNDISFEDYLKDWPG